MTTSDLRRASTRPRTTSPLSKVPEATAAFWLIKIPLGAVKKGGVVSFITSGPTEDAVADFGLVGRKVLANATREVTGPIAAKVASGSMQVSIAQVLDLDHAVDGLATLAAGTARGKLVVVL